MSICDDSSGGNELLTIEEGKARIVNFSKGVFYNPVQEFNRDLSVAAISVFSAEHWKHGTSDGSKRDLVQKERRGEKLDVTHHPFSKHGLSMNKLEQFIHETNFFKRPESFNYKYSWNIEMLPQVEIHYRDPQIKNALTKACRFFEIVVKPVRRKHGKDSAIMSNTAKNSDRKKQRHLKVYLLLLDFSTLKNNSQNIETLPEMIDSSSNSNEQVTENRLSNILVGAQDSFEVIQSTTEFPEFINNEENVLSKESALEIEKTSGLNGCVSIRNSDKKVIARKRFRIVTQGFYGASSDEGQLLAEKNIVNSQLLSEKSNETMEEEAAADHVKEIQFVLDKPHSLVFEIDKHLNNEDAEDRDIIIYPINGESSLKNTGNSVNNEVIEDVEQSFTKQQSLPGKADEISEEKVEGHSQFVDSKPAGEKYDDGITILEALSASGLRSIRYAKEVPGVKQIFANDISTAAVESIKKNVSCNKVEHLVTTSNVNAISHIYERKFYVVDLDPYGSASQFLNAAIENSVDGGFLLVTCTDMAVLAGNVPEACYAKYGSMPLRNSACHEMAIRIVLSCIQEHAADYNKYIVPLLSISADFYIRVFVKLHSFGQIEEIAKNGTSLIQQCTGCHTFRLSQQTILNYPATNRTPVTHILDRFCSHCGKRTVLGGPIWSDPIHDLEFVGKMLSVVKSQHFNTMKRMEGMLKLIFEELNDVPLYYTVESLCSKVHCEVLPQVVFHSALLNAGYKVTLSHCAPNSLKTDAPASVIWDIVRCWVKTHPVSKKRLVEGSVALALLQRKPSMIADFTVNSKAISELKMNKVLRYQQNPQPFWGPGCRDRTNYPSEEMKNKRQMNQNKRIKNKKKRKVDDTTSLVIKTTPSDNEDTCSE